MIEQVTETALAIITFAAAGYCIEAHVIALIGEFQRPRGRYSVDDWNHALRGMLALAAAHGYERRIGPMQIKVFDDALSQQTVRTPSQMRAAFNVGRERHLRIMRDVDGTMVSLPLPPQDIYIPPMRGRELDDDQYPYFPPPWFKGPDGWFYLPPPSLEDTIVKVKR